jgi:hypothetical protein
VRVKVCPGAPIVLVALLIVAEEPIWLPETDTVELLVAPPTKLEVAEIVVPELVAATLLLSLVW